MFNIKKKNYICLILSHEEMNKVSNSKEKYKKKEEIKIILIKKSTTDDEAVKMLRLNCRYQNFHPVTNLLQ